MNSRLILNKYGDMASKLGLLSLFVLTLNGIGGFKLKKGIWLIVVIVRMCGISALFLM